MARCRNLKPGFFHNELLAELPPLTRLLFAGLWCYADREGRLDDRPKRLKTQILPYDTCDVDEALSQLSRGDDPFIIRYQVGGKSLIQIAKWHDNQKPHHMEAASILPALPCTSRAQAVDDPSTKRLEVIEDIGSEVDGTKKNPKQRVTVDQVPIPEGYDTPEVRQALAEWLNHKAGMGKPYRDAAYLGRKVSEFGSPAAFVSAVHSSIGNNYSGIFAPKIVTNAKPRSTKRFVD